MFSRRTVWNPEQNRLTHERSTRSGLLDLTQSNPTLAGIPYPIDELSAIYARAARASYQPAPQGLLSAREAVGSLLDCSPGDIVLTTSTSESYSFLFKLLADPNDVVVTATPSYPLLEHLAQLESVELQTFPLDLQQRWELDTSRIDINARTRALVVVNPNNPTGSFVTPAEQEALAQLGLPLISDEVFLDYPLSQRGSSFVRHDTLTFVLGGLSKFAGMPHLKLGWIRVSGPVESRRAAVAALELIADNFLSVSTPVQAALPELLDLAPAVNADIRARTADNLKQLAAMVDLRPDVELLNVEGGWSALLRVPVIESDEELAIRLLVEHGVLIHPGYFFDFEREGFIVVSLLTHPDVLKEGVNRMLSAIRE